MINSLVINPAVGTARSKVSQYPTARLRYMMYHMSMKGITELKTCQTLRHVSGYAYFDTIPCHLNFSVLIGTSNVWTSILLYPSTEITTDRSATSESNPRLQRIRQRWQR